MLFGGRVFPVQMPSLQRAPAFRIKQWETVIHVLPASIALG